MCCILSVRVTVVTDVKYVFVVPLLSLFIQRFLLDLFIHNVFLAQTLLFKFILLSNIFFRPNGRFSWSFSLDIFRPFLSKSPFEPPIKKSEKKKANLGQQRYI